ncbi:DDB1- and CUL4-associated factor 6-like [Metopolophium dirhodum]|uniref:DDB1- and CUL4-associated factor 6-like n=1 Tax=Metopolophium dirhodum TaxID=44670 RepID=UPI00298FED1D|nr:DDB1- and CUL4-associated factor 6-like [Metopolophium dirhodum]
MFPSEGLFRNVFFQPYNDQGSAKVINSAKNSKHFVQRLDLEKILETHRGCVNSVNWNDSGSLLLTAGDDKHIVITDPFSYKLLVDYKTKHKTNIFCAKFIPTSDNRIISCGADGSVLNLDLERPEETEWNFFTCHSSQCYKLETIPDEPNIFLSCSEDGTVRQYDLRTGVKCTKQRCDNHEFIDCGKPVSTIAINPVKPYQLGIATIDSIVRIVDRRKIIKKDLVQNIVPEFSFTVPHLDHRAYRITSLSYSPDGRDMLASYSYEEIYLFSLSKDSCTTAVANDFLENAPIPPPYRRIRLRGDWADTGPLSRPSTDNLTTSRLQSQIMARMSALLINVFNTPTINNAFMQNWSPNYSSPVPPESLRRTTSSIEPQGELDEVDVPINDIDRLAREYTNSNDDNIEQSTSNRYFQNVENKSKTNKKPPVFDDFVALQPIKAQYKGHRNARTLIKEATFWGNDFIMSGSDCGHVFVWDRYTCEIVMLLKADAHVVNCIQPHPSRLLLATSGVDHNVKLWSPISVDKMFFQSFATELVERNKLMMEQSKDTVTVSPSLIVRMLTYFNQLRRAGSTNTNAT